MRSNAGVTYLLAEIYARDPRRRIQMSRFYDPGVILVQVSRSTQYNSGLKYIIRNANIFVIVGISLL